MRSFATALLVLAIALPAQAADITGRASVIDGDTIDIHSQRTRLYLTQGTAAAPLRDDIARIDIMNERGLLETETHETQASQ